MKYPVLAVAVLVLLVNAALYSEWTAKPGSTGWTPQNGGSDIVPIKDVTVTVPQKRAGDILQFDFDFFGETYYHNLTSGNWSRMTLLANGQRLDSFPGVGAQTDGFGQSHQTYQSHTELRLSATIMYTEYSPGKTSQPLTVMGRLDGDRDQYSTLLGDVTVLTYADGTLKVDDIKGIPGIGMTNFEFSVGTWSYPDPNVAPDVPLEQLIYGNGATLKQGMNGTHSEHQAGWGNYSQVYNWTVEGADRVRGYDCERLNISSDFFGEILFSKVLWLSSDVPEPVRTVYNSTTYTNSSTEESHIILNTTQTLQRDGYIRGGAPIDVQPDAKEGFLTRHPSADLRTWETAPEDGPLEGSSFDFGLIEGLDYAGGASPGFKDWLKTHPRPMVSYAQYSQNTTNQGLNVDEYIWNVTLAGEPGDWEDHSWYRDNSYTLNLSKQVERRPILGDRVTYAVESEDGPHRGATPVMRTDLSPTLVTLASSEAIWAQFPQVAAKAYKGITHKVDFKNAVYALQMGGVSPTGFGMSLLDTLTGVSVPTTNYTWTLQMGNVYSGTSTYMAAVDVETGRMVFISDVTGSGSLARIFGAGG